MGPLSNGRQEKFCRNVVAGMTATDAYEDAGYKPNDANAARLNGNDRIKTRIAELQAEVARQVVQRTGIDRARWLAELGRIAFSDVRKVVTWRANASEIYEDEDTGEPRLAVSNQVQIIDADQLDDETAAAIAEVSQTDKGGLKIKLHDKLKALDLIGRAEGFLDSDGPKVKVNVGVLVDRPPRETLEEWTARQERERSLRLAGPDERQT